MLVYTAGKYYFGTGDEDIVAQTLTTGRRSVLLHDAADARYVPTGHLVFMRQGVLLAVPFDPVALKVKGEAVPVLNGVAQSTRGGSNDLSMAGQFAVSSTGNLAWLEAEVAPITGLSLVSMDRHGQVNSLNAPERAYGHRVRLSPDGRQLAITALGAHGYGLWSFDVVRATLTPLLQDGEVTSPVWRPDGLGLAFDWRQGSRRSLGYVRVDGSAPAESLTAEPLTPSSWTPDGRQLAALRDMREGPELVIVSRESGKGIVTNWASAHAMEFPEFSPDGRWIAYTTWDSGRWDSYVQAYPGPGPRVPLSAAGGCSPAWRRDGRVLFFALGPDCGTSDKYYLMEVDFLAGSPPRLGTPRQLFEFDHVKIDLTGNVTRFFEPSPDGQRFYAVQDSKPKPSPVATRINIVENWLDELKARVPVR